METKISKVERNWSFCDRLLLKNQNNFDWLFVKLIRASNYGQTEVWTERFIDINSTFGFLALSEFSSQKRNQISFESSSPSKTKRFKLRPRNKTSKISSHWTIEKVSDLRAIVWHTRTIKTPTQGTKSMILKSNLPLRQNIVHWKLAERCWACRHGERRIGISTWISIKCTFWKLRRIKSRNQKSSKTIPIKYSSTSTILPLKNLMGEIKPLATEKYDCRNR